MKDKFNSRIDPVLLLLEQAKKGSQTAFAELLDFYEPLFHSLLAKVSDEEVNEQDIEDIRQELTVVFYHSILSYDLKQSEVRFGLYAKICMSNSLITQLRKVRRHQSSMATVADDNGDPFDFLCGDEDPTEAVRDREAIDTLNQKIESALSPYEMKVWQLYLAGNSSSSIATSLNKEEKSIENAIFRIRKKLRLLFQ